MQASNQDSNPRTLRLLLPHLSPLDRPREMRDGNDEKAVLIPLVSPTIFHTSTQRGIRSQIKWHIPIGIIRNPRQRIIPSQERRQEPEKAAGFDKRGVRVPRGIAMQVSDAEEEESEIEGEE